MTLLVSKATADGGEVIRNATIHGIGIDKLIVEIVAKIVELEICFSDEVFEETLETTHGSGEVEVDVFIGVFGEVIASGFEGKLANLVGKARGLTLGREEVAIEDTGGGGIGGKDQGTEIIHQLTDAVNVGGKSFKVMGTVATHAHRDGVGEEDFAVEHPNIGGAELPEVDGDLGLILADGEHFGEKPHEGTVTGNGAKEAFVDGVEELGGVEEILEADAPKLHKPPESGVLSAVVCEKQGEAVGVGVVHFLEPTDVMLVFGSAVEFFLESVDNVLREGDDGSGAFRAFGKQLVELLNEFFELGVFNAVNGLVDGMAERHDLFDHVVVFKLVGGIYRETAIGKELDFRHANGVAIKGDAGDGLLQRLGLGACDGKAFRGLTCTTRCRRHRAGYNHMFLALGWWPISTNPHHTVDVTDTPPITPVGGKPF